MILSGLEIKERLGEDIIIDPFLETRVNPNSYNLTLNEELVIYDRPVLDMKADNSNRKIIIPQDGLILMPNTLYLGRTNEFTETHNLVPMLEGRSSIGRLGLYIHVTAGFGDVGFAGYWTLEMHCIHPIIIYPNVEICQIYYHMIEGRYHEYITGKYQNNKGIQTSKMFKEFE
jgi:dCTP deaminase